MVAITYLFIGMLYATVLLTTKIFRDGVSQGQLVEETSRVDWELERKYTQTSNLCGNSRQYLQPTIPDCNLFGHVSHGSPYRQNMTCYVKLQTYDDCYSFQLWEFRPIEVKSVHFKFKHPHNYSSTIVIEEYLSTDFSGRRSLSEDLRVWWQFYLKHENAPNNHWGQTVKYAKHSDYPYDKWRTLMSKYQHYYCGYLEMEGYVIFLLILTAMTLTTYIEMRRQHQRSQ